MGVNYKERQQRIYELAGEVLNLSRNTLVVNLRFMDAALAQLKPLALSCEGISIATDGEHLVYEARYLLQTYKEEREIPVRDYLHIILHCVFRHMYAGPSIQKDIWNLACDIAVESVISELQLKAASAKREQKQQAVISSLKTKLNSLTAEKIYRHYLDNPPVGNELNELCQMFRGDDHLLWYMSAEEKAALGIGSGSLSNGEFDSDSDSGGGLGASVASGSALEQRWKTLSERMQQDLETFSKDKGDMAGNLVQNLKAVNREKYDYTSFLKKFAVRGEVMKINEDEFDYIFYTYGLDTYKNVPLIEPLEYKDVKRIKEFVIAIDTSGSVAGDIVQKFVQKTYNILKSTESFFSRINLHIIQCDAQIQEHVKITSQDEFDHYLDNMEIQGLGGTDFRPVFEKVNELINEKEFSNLKGMIYFTDGFGNFPSKKPDYQTAFVFLEEDTFNPEVPPWAIKLVLRKEEI